MPPRVSHTTDVHAISNVFTLAFRHSPFMAYLKRRPDSEWPVSSIPIDILGPKMLEGATYKKQLGAELVEADNFAAAAIWFPPGVDLPSSSNDDPRLVEVREIFGRVKKQFLNGRKYWYLNMIARHPERTEPGVIRALFEPYFARAQEQGVPLWLEAISEHSKQVYEHLGFKTVAAMRMGEGMASPDGELREGGEGLLVYAMIKE